MSREADIFEEASALPPAGRSAFLDQACAGDSALRARVDGLLDGYAEIERALPSPLIARAAITSGEKPGDRIGRYHLREKIGEGGCGVVWMAEQQEPVHRRVALKVIKLGLDTKAVVARFEAERQALALMDHPNIAQIFDAGATDHGRPYFVMELVRGTPIARFCDDRNLPNEQRLALFIQVCQAIEHAHQKGIIHRDIKPSNILVALHDDVAVPKVIDFGIAKATQGKLTDATLVTAVEQFIGTPAYMSPELAELGGLEIDPRSDVYSLGVVLYELLTGQPPFDPKTLQQAGIDEVRRIIREVEPARPSTRLNTLAEAERATLARLRRVAPGQLSTQLRGDLDWIVIKALEKDRTRRYASAGAFALDVKRHLGLEPVAARAPSAAYVVGKFLRRHRLPLSVGALVVAGMITSTAVSVGLLSARRPGPPGPPVPEKSIAVLPFKNQSTDPRDASFADGIQEDIRNNLAHLRELRVVSRTSAEPYRETRKTAPQIAQELGVSYLLEGSVQRDGNRVRVTCRFARAATDEQVWAKTYSRDLSDIFTLQIELAQAVAAELQTTLSPGEKELIARRSTENPWAYELWLRARELQRKRVAGDRSWPVKMEALLEMALEADPKFAEAWAELANTEVNFIANSVDTTPARVAKATAAIKRAEDLAPDSAEVLRSLGAYYRIALKDPERAAQQFEALLRLQPNDSDANLRMGNLQFNAGRYSEGTAHVRRAVQLDPGNLEAANELLEFTSRGRRFAEAMDVKRRMIALRPEHWRYPVPLAVLAFQASGSTRELEALVAQPDFRYSSHVMQVKLALYQGDYAEAVRRDRLQSTPDNEEWQEAPDIAMAYLIQGEAAAARARLAGAAESLRAQLARDPDNTRLIRYLARIEAVLGTRDAAFGLADRAVALSGHIGFVNQNARYVLAQVCAILGEKDRAIAELTHLLHTPSQANIHELRVLPVFHPLRGDPRFAALVNDPEHNEPLF